MKMKQRQNREFTGTINLILAAGLIFVCLFFLGGMKVGKSIAPTLTVSSKVTFAEKTVAGTTAGSQVEWRRIAEKHPDLMIQSACSESHE